MHLLRNNAGNGKPVVPADGGQIGAIDGDTTGLRRHGFLQKPEECRFSGAGLAGDEGQTSRRCSERNTFDAATVFVAKTHLIKLNRLARQLQRTGVWKFLLCWLVPHAGIGRELGEGSDRLADRLPDQFKRHVELKQKRVEENDIAYREFSRLMARQQQIKADDHLHDECKRDGEDKADPPQGIKPPVPIDRACIVREPAFHPCSAARVPQRLDHADGIADKTGIPLPGFNGLFQKRRGQAVRGKRKRDEGRAINNDDGDQIRTEDSSQQQRAEQKRGDARNEINKGDLHDRRGGRSAPCLRSLNLCRVVIVEERRMFMDDALEEARRRDIFQPFRMDDRHILCGALNTRRQCRQARIERKTEHPLQRRVRQIVDQAGKHVRPGGGENRAEQDRQQQKGDGRP
ncbi:hypothetical protein D3C80_962590 [compost metagenome]